MTDPIQRSSLALRRIALLQGLSDQRLDRLAQQCLWHTVDADHTLMARADDRGEVCFLVSGSVRVTTYSAQGRQVTFRDCEAGEMFGDIAAVDGLPRSADVVTLQPSVVASLDRAAFRALLREEPDVAERVMLRLTALVRQLSERVIDLSTLGVQHRLHAELLRIARLAGVVDNQARLSPPPRLSKRRVASPAAVARSRQLRSTSLRAVRPALAKSSSRTAIWSKPAPSSPELRPIRFPPVRAKPKSSWHWLASARRPPTAS